VARAIAFVCGRSVVGVVVVGVVVSFSRAAMAAAPPPR
jgi:hypothetical protein